MGTFAHPTGECGQQLTAISVPVGHQIWSASGQKNMRRSEHNAGSPRSSKNDSISVSTATAACRSLSRIRVCFVQHSNSFQLLTGRLQTTVAALAVSGAAPHSLAALIWNATDVPQKCVGDSMRPAGSWACQTRPRCVFSKLSSAHESRDEPGASGAVNSFEVLRHTGYHSASLSCRSLSLFCQLLDPCPVSWSMLCNKCHHGAPATCSARLDLSQADNTNTLFNLMIRSKATPVLMWAARCGPCLAASMCRRMCCAAHKTGTALL